MGIAASIVNANLVVGLTAGAATQYAVASASAFAACVVGLAIVFFSSADASSSSPLVAAPLVAALCWALYAIRAELKKPELIVNCAAYKEIGEVGRNALELIIGGSAIALACGSLAIAAAQSVRGAGWLELK